MDSYQSGLVPCGAKPGRGKTAAEAAIQLISYDIEYLCDDDGEEVVRLITNPTIASIISMGSTSWAMR